MITQQREAVDALLVAGADASLTDRHGNTALHLAAQQREGDMVAQMLRHHEVAELADVPNSMGMSPPLRAWMVLDQFYVSLILMAW